MTATAIAEPTVKTATVTTGSLRTLLAAAVPFTDDRDGTLPTLGCIQIQAGGGVIVATATDRYVLGHIRQQATGTLAAVNLPNWEAYCLIGWLNARIKWADDNSELVELTLRDDDRLLVKQGDREFTAQTRNDWKFPDLGPIIAAAATGSEPASMVGIGLGPLSKIRAALAELPDAQTSPIRWTGGAAKSPIRIEVGGSFLAFLMPMNPADRWGKMLADYPPVPFGIPAEEVQA